MSLRRLVSLLAALALALLPAACGGDSAGGSGSARELLDTAAKKPAKSADVKLELEASLDGVDELKGPLKLSLEGPYRSNGPTSLPDLDWRVSGEAAGQRFDARLITLRDNAWVEYGGATYEVGTQLVSKLTEQLRANETRQKQGFDTTKWIEDGEVSEAEVGGVATKRISGDIDVKALLASLDKLSRSSGQGIPPQAADQIADAVKEAHVETDVGADDGILRRTSLKLRFEVPDDRRAEVKGLEGGELDFVLEQTGVNGDQSVTRPSGARPIDELLRGMGIPPELLLGPGFSTPAPN